MSVKRPASTIAGSLGSALKAVAVDGSVLTLEHLLERFAQEGIVPRIDDALTFATVNQVLLLRHALSGMDIDISIAWLPFELEAIAASETLDLGGIRVPMARPEDLLIYKAIAWRPQDQQDVERLLTISGKQVDLLRVRRIVAEFPTALDEPMRLAELDLVVSRVLG